MPKERNRIKTTSWDGLIKDGPGAATGSVPIGEVEAGGHALEPSYKRVPVGPDHFLYPLLVSLALFPILMGAAGHHLAEDMPEKDTHPFYPDHFWPYPIIAALVLAALGLMAAALQANMALDQAANPRAVVIPRPDWYFLWLFQFLKLGPDLLTAFVIPGAAVLTLLFWPLLDQSLGPRLAKVKGWKRWPVPGRNVYTGVGFTVFVAIITFLEFWALAGFTLPWFTGPVTGG